MRIELVSGSGDQVVQIQSNGDGFYSVLIINCGNGLEHPNAQVILGKCHRTEVGARRWAAKQLAA